MLKYTLLLLAASIGASASRRFTHQHAVRDQSNLMLEVNYPTGTGSTPRQPVQPPAPAAWIMNLTQACLPTLKQLNANKASIVKIAEEGNQQQWSCVSEIITKNPESTPNDIEMTADCFERTSEWNERDDAINLLKLRADPKIKKLLSVMTLLIFLVLQMTMLALGCEILISEVKKHAARPVGAIIAVAAQFGVMPLGAFAIGRLLKMDFYPSIALIICGCCPGGNLSNLLAFGVRGDMNLSILMTTCSSIGGLILMPLMIALYGGWTKAIFAADPASQGVELTIPFANIAFNLMLTLLPCSIGCLLANKFPNIVGKVQKAASGLMLLCTILLIIDVIYIFGIDLILQFKPNVVAACCLLPLLGYVSGYFCARWVDQPRALSRTIAIETGCQNVQLCAVILRTGFPWCDIGIYFLLPLIYIAFQLFWALIAVGIVRFRQAKALLHLGRGQGDMTREEIDEEFGRKEPEGLALETKKLKEDKKNKKAILIRSSETQTPESIEEEWLESKKGKR